MTDDELDIVLSQEERITASSGFTESVMAALNSEASTPPPIAFPWKWALPGFAAAVVLLGGICLMALRLMEEPSTASLLPIDSDLVANLAWLFGGLALSLVSVKLSMYWTEIVRRPSS